MEILYSDGDLAAVVKPAGLDSEHDMPQAIIQALGGECYPIHRLDKNVAGVMVYGRSKAGAAALSKLVQEGQFQKEYRCLVHGTPPDAGTWEDLLFKDSRKNKVFVVKRERKGVKKACLSFRRCTAGPESLIHVSLHTGRSHQIRVQFASRGFPLVGDHKYGARDEAKAPMLYSCRIQFPWKGKMQCFSSFPTWGLEPKDAPGVESESLPIAHSGLV